MVENGRVYGPCPCTRISQTRRAKALVLWSWEVSFGQSESQFTVSEMETRQPNGLCPGLGILNQAGRGGQPRYGGESRYLPERGKDKRKSFGRAMRNGTVGRMLGWVTMELGVLAGCPLRFSRSWGWTPPWGPGSAEPQLTVGARLSLCLPHPTCDVGRTLPELRGSDMKEVRTIARCGL